MAADANSRPVNGGGGDGNEHLWAWLSLRGPSDPQPPWPGAGDRSGHGQAKDSGLIPNRKPQTPAWSVGGAAPQPREISGVWVAHTA